MGIIPLFFYGGSDELERDRRLHLRALAFHVRAHGQRDHGDDYEDGVDQRRLSNRQHDAAGHLGRHEGVQGNDLRAGLQLRRQLRLYGAQSGKVAGHLQSDGRRTPGR